MKRIYVAGNYSTNDNGGTANIIEAMQNIRAGQKASMAVWKAGFIPFCPWLDYQFCLVDDEPPTIKMFQEYSMAWLEVSDAVLVISGAGNGGGVDAEIERARDLNIPIFYNIRDLIRV